MRRRRKRRRRGIKRSRSSSRRVARQSRPQCGVGGHPLVAPSVQAQRTLPEEKKKKTACFFEPFISKENVLFYIKCCIYFHFKVMWVYYIREIEVGLLLRREPRMFCMAATCTHGRASMTCHGETTQHPQRRATLRGRNLKWVLTGFESTVRLRKIHCLSVDVDVNYLFVFQVYLF